MKTRFLTLGRPAARAIGRLLALGLFAVVGLTSQAGASEPPRSTIPRLTTGGLSPVPFITSISNSSSDVTVSWYGLTPPYVLESATDLSDPHWTAAAPGTTTNSLTVAREAFSAFFRVQGQPPNFVGADTCMQCHRGRHTGWMGTAHAAAFQTLKDRGRHTTARCLECHVVGYGLPNGFVSEAATPHLAGVQCENCHGPGGNHALDPANISFRPKVEMSSKMCGGCHSGQHHPFYNEWEHSHHSIALGTIANSSFARDTCLECHSQDYRYAVEEGLTPPTKATAQLSIECSTCHHPHRATAGVPAQLRRPIAQLCGECHTVEESLLGSSPHHPQFEMLSGIGMFREDGSALTNSTSAHALLASTGGESCATCHVVQHESDDPTAAFPHVTGHTFNPFDESIEEHQPAQYAGCADCHTPSGFFSAEYLRPLMQAEITERLAALAPYFTASHPSYINPATLSATDSNRLSVAKFNYQFVGADSSKGIHNPFNAREGLDIAESIVESLANPPAVMAQGGSK